MAWKIEASRRCGCWALCLLGVGLSACGTEGSSPEWPRFTDRATASGLTEPVRAGDAQKADVLEANTGGDGLLRDVTVLSGSGLRVTAVSRGAALGDLDEDGDLDVVIVNLDSIPSLMRNEGISAGWLSVELEGTRRNRMAIGARVVVRSQDGHSQFREIHAGTGYLSQDDHRLHFGTGAIDSVQIKVHWPGGRVESLGRMGVRQHVRINSGNDG